MIGTPVERGAAPIDAGEILAVIERGSDWIRVVTDDGRLGSLPANAHRPRA